MLPSTTSMAIVAPNGLISWPMNQGKAIPPRLDPTKKMLVILPDRCMRLCASFNKVGKIEAIKKPVPIVPSQRNISAEENAIRKSRLIIIPQKLIHNIF